MTVYTKCHKNGHTVWPSNLLLEIDPKEIIQQMQKPIYTNKFIVVLTINQYKSLGYYLAVKSDIKNTYDVLLTEQN